MPLFRLHRGGLKESLKTTVIVKDVNELVDAIRNGWDFRDTWDIKIFPYYNEDSCFDARIGWYTQMVTADLIEDGVFLPVGFLSEPISGWENLRVSSKVI